MRNSTILTLKRVALVIYGPFIFVGLIISAVLFRKKTWFPIWYRKEINRWSKHLLKMLSIDIVTDQKTQENLRKSNYEICIATHQSHLDSVVLQAVYPREKNLRFVAKESLFKIPLLGAGLKASGAISINRSRGREALACLREALAHMGSKESVIIYPEGTRTSGSRLGSLKKGAFILAKETGRDLLPIVIHGAEIVYPRGAIMPHPGKIIVQCMEPISMNESTSVGDLLEIVQTKFFINKSSNLEINEGE